MIMAIMLTIANGGYVSVESDSDSAPVLVVSCTINGGNTDCKSGQIKTYDPTAGSLSLEHQMYFDDTDNCSFDSFTCNMVTTGVTDLCTTSNSNIAAFDSDTGVMRLGQSVPPSVSQYVFEVEATSSDGSTRTCTWEIEPIDPCPTAILVES